MWKNLIVSNNMSHILFDKKEKTLKYVDTDMVMDELYYFKVKLPTQSNIDDYVKSGTNKNILKYIKDHDNVRQTIKDEISKIENKVPLYDEYTKNLYIIPKENVYERVVYMSYRFPNKILKANLKKRRDELKPSMSQDDLNDKTWNEEEATHEIHYNVLHKLALMKREYSKLIMLLQFLKSFNVDILETTYVRVFYFFAKEVGKDMTVCVRPSFLPHFVHIDPYYRRSELINLALNLEIIRPDNKHYDQKEIMKLCDVIKKNDVSSIVIMKHQEHIIKNDRIGMVQYYSMQGSYFINKYMRDFSTNSYRNEIIENIVKSTYDLVNTAPPFDKSYILYRFVSDDAYLKYLNIGDVYIDPSFISTTRNPFYSSITYKFGFILIKIKVPKNIIGVGLSIEAYSHFPDEQEIILAPFSKLRLDKKDENALYYHPNEEQVAKVSVRYEFTYMGRNNLKFVNKLKPDTMNVVDFLKMKNTGKEITVYDKIKFFIQKCVNEIFQFSTKIGPTIYKLIVEWYDSTGPYNKFYGATTSNGFSIYAMVDGYILFFIELGEEEDETYMYVDYYFKFAEPKVNDKLKDTDFIEFLAKLAYYFSIRDVLLYSSYASCDLGKKIQQDVEIYRGGNYCVDFYRYLKYKEKRFGEIDSTEVKPKFSYYQLDRLKSVDPIIMLDRMDKDEVYQIYTKTYKIHVDPNKHNLLDFYIWLVDNQCVQLKFLIDKMHKVFDTNNPFDNDYYLLDAAAYLNNRGMIADYLSFKKSKIIGIKSKEYPNKNEYRINTIQERTQERLKSIVAP